MTSEEADFGTFSESDLIGLFSASPSAEAIVVLREVAMVNEV